MKASASQRVVVPRSTALTPGLRAGILPNCACLCADLLSADSPGQHVAREVIQLRETFRHFPYRFT